MRLIVALILGLTPLLQASLAHAAAETANPKFRPEPPPEDRKSAVPKPDPVVVPPPQPQPAYADPCGADIVERSGILSLTLHDSARSNQSTTATVDDLTYTAHFDGAGLLHVEAPLFHALSDVDWTGGGGRACHHRGIGFSGFQSSSRVALVWTGAFDLALHVIEPPDGRLGGSVRYVYPGRPNLEGTTALGSLRHFGEAVAGTSQVELYNLPIDRKPEHGYFLFLTEITDRGNPARLPYCSGGALANIRYSMLALVDGQLSRRGFATQAVSCGQTWDTSNSDSGYYQRFSWSW